MIIDEQFNRRVRIEGRPNDMEGFKLYVRDADTGESINNVACAVIYLNPTKVNEVELTYYASDGQGRLITVDGEVVKKKVRVDRPEIAVTAFEREFYGNFNQ